jgi:hypothetical protein
MISEQTGQFASPWKAADDEQEAAGRDAIGE